MTSDIPAEGHDRGKPILWCGGSSLQGAAWLFRLSGQQAAAFKRPLYQLFPESCLSGFERAHACTHSCSGHGFHYVPCLGRFLVAHRSPARPWTTSHLWAGILIVLKFVWHWFESTSSTNNSFFRWENLEHFECDGQMTWPVNQSPACKSWVRTFLWASVCRWGKSWDTDARLPTCKVKKALFLGNSAHTHIHNTHTHTLARHWGHASSQSAFTGLPSSNYCPTKPWISQSAPTMSVQLLLTKSPKKKQGCRDSREEGWKSMKGWKNA